MKLLLLQQTYRVKSIEWASFFSKKARKAEQRGKQMVQDLGAQPVLKDLAKKGGPTNIEQRAAFATANRIAAAELETEASLDIDKVLTQAEINKTPFSQVSQNLPILQTDFQLLCLTLIRNSGHFAAAYQFAATKSRKQIQHNL